MSFSENLSDIERQARGSVCGTRRQEVPLPSSEPEQAELLRLQAYLDEAEAGFYEPVERRLESFLVKSNPSDRVL
ncbi:MAG TPA: hypothetical protein VHC97_28310 [Thermoanaerobaculia bacterium]|jgi:hypothetical protein|nr:hypothetical protein [Thermoanaerobaculia bacterium]